MKFMQFVVVILTAFLASGAVTSEPVSAYKHNATLLPTPIVHTLNCSMSTYIEETFPADSHPPQFTGVTGRHEILKFHQRKHKYFNDHPDVNLEATPWKMEAESTKTTFGSRVITFGHAVLNKLSPISLALVTKSQFVASEVRCRVAQ